MEQETFFSEKSNFAIKNKKYGSTNHNNSKRNSLNEVLIRHDLTKTDTLQGIAIQYGCSVSIFASSSA
jgi:hypothetical protein